VSRSVDSITLQVIREGLIALCRSMGYALSRTAYSPIFSEGFDFSCALFDGTGEMVAQAEFNPVHLGSMPYAVEWALLEIGLDQLTAGDVILHNDPYRGGTHLSDFTMMAPVFFNGRLIAIPAVRGHQIDVGGMAPGGFPGDATEIFQEGIRVPPVRVHRAGREMEDVWKLLLANLRVPRVMHGDLRAMFGSLKVAERRVQEYCIKYGVDIFEQALVRMKDYSERRMRSEISKLPDGVYEFEDFVEDDGVSLDPLCVKCRLTIDGETIVADFDGSSQQCAGPVNATFAVTASQVYTVVFQVTDPTMPSNHGSFRPIKLLAPAGTVVNANYPAAVFGGNVEMSSRIMDVLIGCFAKAVPERVMAASFGTCHNFTAGARHPERGEYSVVYIYHEGGWGARATADGLTAVINPIGNDMNQPVEIFETRFPWRYLEYSLNENSGGAGRYRGGLGVRQRLQLLADSASMSLIAERFRRPPFGLFGGHSPLPSECGHYNDSRLLRPGDSAFHHVPDLFQVVSPSKWARVRILRGTVVENRTTGGGGYGDPYSRPPEMVREDVLDGYVSVQAAVGEYGVVLDEHLAVDIEATRRVRQQKVSWEVRREQC
jgi:N-methylhydantoinase B/oxoprolinase/acetone carboxylase alpha subunit